MRQPKKLALLDDLAPKFGGGAGAGTGASEEAGSEARCDRLPLIRLGAGFRLLVIWSHSAPGRKAVAQALEDVMRYVCLVALFALVAGCSSDTGSNSNVSNTASEDATDSSEQPDGGAGEFDSGSSNEDGGTSAGHDCDDPHADWLFCEDFTSEDGDFAAWFEESDFVQALGEGDRGRVDLSDEHATSGDWSVYMPAVEESDYQGAELTWVACDGEQEVNCERRGYDRLHFRTMIRFADDHEYVHHFLRISGLDRFWRYGSAGCMPNGESAMGTTVDFEEGSHDSFFYTYHLDMNCDTNCGDYMDVESVCEDCADKGFPTCGEQQQCCWGNHFAPEDDVSFPVGEWFCFEMMMEANTPGERDGQMAYWVNDELAHRVDDVAWRTNNDLQLDRVGLQHFIAPGDADSPNRVWFDDVVVSTERIGCPQ